MKLAYVIAISFLFMITACSSSPEKPDSQADSVTPANEQKAVNQSTEEAPPEEPDKPTPRELNAKKNAEGIGPVATVNGMDIPAVEFAMEFLVPKGVKRRPSLADKHSAITMHRLTERYIIETTVAEKNVEVSEEEMQKKVEKSIESFAERKKLDPDEVTLKDVANDLGQSRSRMENFIHRNAAFTSLVRERGFEAPTQKEIRAFYEKHREKRYSNPDEVHVLYMVASVDGADDEAAWSRAEKKAREFYEKSSADGADFKALVKNYSDGPMAERGGDMGFVSRRRLPKEVAEKAFSARDGSISEPFRSRFGWHVIKVVDSREARTQPFEEVSAEITEQLESKALQSARKAYIDELREKAKIEIKDENLDAIVERLISQSDK